MWEGPFNSVDALVHQQVGAVAKVLAAYGTDVLLHALVAVLVWSSC